MDIKKIASIEDGKYYLTAKLSDHREIFDNTYEVALSRGNLEVTEDTVSEIIRMSGVPKTLSNVLKGQDFDLWVSNIITMCEYYYSGDIVLLVEGNTITHVSFNKVRPLLNVEFFKTMSSLLEDYTDLVKVEMFSYSSESYLSSITVFPTRTYEYQGIEYKLGVVFTNNELDTITCKLVVETPTMMFYLPTRYYNLSASRYLKTSEDRAEALSQLVLRVLESISQDSWFSIIPEVDMNLKNCAKIQATYEEFKQSNRLLNTICAEADVDPDSVEGLREHLNMMFQDFEQNYPLMDEKKGNYIWRCSALSNNSIYALILHLNEWSQSNLFYPENIVSIRELIGEYVMLSRISTNLAKRKQ